MSRKENLLVNEPEPFKDFAVTPDKYTEDSLLKNKLRSINLIKYNPTLFTNRGGRNFFEMMGGDKTLLTVLGCGALAVFYRSRVNVLRLASKREGIWYTSVYFFFGASLGLFYSTVFFCKWQVLMNDYFAHYLMKRYAGSNLLNGRNIYHVKDVENNDEIYRFSNSYMNSFHL
jgi:hypothetical protein